MKYILSIMLVALVGCGSTNLKQGGESTLSVAEFNAGLEESMAAGGHSEYAKQAMKGMVPAIVSGMADCAKYGSADDSFIGLKINPDGKVQEFVVSKDNKASKCMANKLAKVKMPRHEKKFRYIRVLME